MYNLFGQQKSFKEFFHHKPVFHNIASIRIRMMGGVNINISIRANHLAAPPIRIGRAFASIICKYFPHFPRMSSTIKRTILSIFISWEWFFYAVRVAVSKKFLFTIKTMLMNWQVNYFKRFGYFFSSFFARTFSFSHSLFYITTSRCERS